MSPTTDNFIHSLVEMSKAFEELPNVRSELDRANDQVEAYAKQVQRLEMSLIERKNELEAAHEARRKVEAERDDAEYRFLESEDRTKQALNFIRSTFGSAGSLIQALEPPAPTEPVAPAQPPAEQEHRFDTQADAQQPQGLSAADPTPAQEPSSPVPDAPSQQPVETSHLSVNSTEPQAGPYAGKRYDDMPKYIPRQQWIEGGGTEADYDWRPTYSKPPMQMS